MSGPGSEPSPSTPTAAIAVIPPIDVPNNATRSIPRSPSHARAPATSSTSRIPNVVGASSTRRGRGSRGRARPRSCAGTVRTRRCPGPRTRTSRGAARSPRAGPAPTSTSSAVPSAGRRAAIARTGGGRRATAAAPPRRPSHRSPVRAPPPPPAFAAHPAGAAPHAGEVAVPGHRQRDGRDRGRRDPRLVAPAARSVEPGSVERGRAVPPGPPSSSSVGAMYSRIGSSSRVNSIGITYFVDGLAPICLSASRYCSVIVFWSTPVAALKMRVSASLKPSARRIAACRSPSALRISDCFWPSATLIADCRAPRIR